MIQGIILAIIKVLDNILTTYKSITTYQNKKILSSILVIINQFMFYFVIQQVISDSSITSIIIVSLASGIGTYVAFLINDMFKKDMQWMNILTCSNQESITELCNYLVQHKIKYVVNESFTRSWEETYSVMAFAKTKNESKLIDDFLQETSTKYLREIIR